MKPNGVVTLLSVLLAFWPQTANPPKPQNGKDYVLRVSEMDRDIVTFEVFLPEREAGRKNVEHKVFDVTRTVVSVEKFGTGSGHYKITMIGSYVHRDEYEFVIDGRYRLKFTFTPGYRRHTNNRQRALPHPLASFFEPKIVIR